MSGLLASEFDAAPKQLIEHRLVYVVEPLDVEATDTAAVWAERGKRHVLDLGVQYSTSSVLRGEKPTTGQVLGSPRLPW